MTTEVRTRPDAAALQALLDRVEAAEDFDREIDRAIGLALDGWTLERLPNVMRADGSGVDDVPFIRIGNDWVADDPGGEYTAFTDSIDEAVVLVEKVLPGCSWSVNNVCEASIDTNTGSFLGDATIERYAIAKTPALALCAALLKALVAKSERERE